MVRLVFGFMYHIEKIRKIVSYSVSLTFKKIFQIAEVEGKILTNIK